MNKRKTLYIKAFLLTTLVFVTISCFQVGKKPNTETVKIKPINLANIKVTKGMLFDRMQKSFDRLEEKKYRPENVFLTEKQSGAWPGDTEGRTMLALILEAQATGRTPKHLDAILAKLPSKLNEKGYMGPVHNYYSEQQLSGNGWMLRALCEYYEWKKDEKILATIQRLVDNLFIPIKGHYKDYPITKEELGNVSEGGMSGHDRDKIVNGWKLSSDVGCVFIGMEGLIHAYKLLPEPDTKEVIDEMIAQLMKVDFVAIKAQTHATLTASRGLLRYDQIRGVKEYAKKVEEIWALYKAYGMTETYGNYNWFCRYDTWTEPCAIIDSYMVAHQLWAVTQNPKYLEDAELIYYNALSHGQRKNGGFGCDNTPGHKSDIWMKIHANEAHWCCTMRGGEGLTKALQYAVYSQGNQSFITSYHNFNAKLALGEGKLELETATDYPFGRSITVNVKSSDIKGKTTLNFFLPSYWESYDITLNGKEVKAKTENQFIVLDKSFKNGDKIVINYTLSSVLKKPLNKENCNEKQRIIHYGPLVLGYVGEKAITLEEESKIVKKGNEYYLDGELIKLTPVHHLMDSAVWKTEPVYSKQVIFNLL